MWVFASDRPIYLQIVDRLTLDIIRGRYKPGERLPSVRDLAVEAAVNPNTMQRALAEMEQKGLVETQRNSGKFVTSQEAIIEGEKQKAGAQAIEECLAKLRALGVDAEQAITWIKENNHATHS
nr:GntR family transcriptional regulator [bacterium]